MTDWKQEKKQLRKKQIPLPPAIKRSKIAYDRGNITDEEITSIRIHENIIPDQRPTTQAHS